MSKRNMSSKYRDSNNEPEIEVFGQRNTSSKGRSRSKKKMSSGPIKKTQYNELIEESDDEPEPTKLTFSMMNPLIGQKNSNPFFGGKEKKKRLEDSSLGELNKMHEELIQKIIQDEERMLKEHKSHIENMFNSSKFVSHIVRN